MRWKAQFIFTPDNWNIAQDIIIQAADDYDIERNVDPIVVSERYFIQSGTTSVEHQYAAGQVGNIFSHIGVIHHEVSSSDPFYDSDSRAAACPSSTALPVYVRVIDNDVAGVFSTETSLSVTEGGPSALFVLKLLARPTQDVHIDLLFDNKG